MIPAEFTYKKANSVDEAISLLSGGDTQALAGGHSLIPAMKLRLNAPGTLVDIGKIRELNYIREEGGAIIIGSATTHADVAGSSLIQKHVAMISDAAGMIGDIQVRNVGTVGGSIAHADPAADWPAVLLAAGATIVTRGPDGERHIGATDFFTGFFETALEAGEIITSVHIPIPAADTKTAYAKFKQPASRFALVGCAVMVRSTNGTCSAANVAFTGVTECAFRDSGVEEALTGQALTAENISSAADRAAAGRDILGDHFASTEYRAHLAKVFAKRALNAAV